MGYLLTDLLAVQRMTTALKCLMVVIGSSITTTPQLRGVSWDKGLKSTQ
jgi:hypothetical protein